MLNNAWYTLGSIRMVHNTTNYGSKAITITADASLKSLMGKYELGGMRGKVTEGYINCNSNATYSLTATTVSDYSPVTMPNAISLNPTSVAPGGTSTLSWSGAGHGTENAITGYQV